MSELTATYALAVMFDAALRLGLLAAVAEIITWKYRATASAMVHRAWQIVLGAGLIVPLVVAATPARVYVQPDPSVIGEVGNGLARSASVVLLVWGSGLGVGLLKLAFGLGAIRRLRRAAHSLGPNDVRRIRRTVSVPTGRPARTIVLQSDSVCVPVTIGVLRPCVLLPQDWRTWDDSRLAAVLAHELAHIERADYATGVAAAVVRALWWWHPAAWLAASRLSLTAELASDARATTGIDPARYASDLLAFAGDAARRPPRYGWTVGATSRLSARVDALLSAAARGRSPQSKRATVPILVLLLALLCACAAASVRIAPRQVRPGSAALVPDAVDLRTGHTAVHRLRHSGH
jgi:beta-lactamase regulating signal transducer with metallopeptidase domain